ncbi:T9SS type A sorting domain-containing protein, partial [bacterium]|nr:T9SS type A sorting domain-containing protein [bacterium]
DDDSFWVKMGNGGFQMYNGLVTNGWEWVKIDEYELTEGLYHLEIGYREDGAKLDKICLSLHLTDIEGFGEEAENICNPSSVQHSITGPDYFALGQNYPNPFNPSTSIDYQLPEKVFVTLKIFDILGNEVETLVNGSQHAGNHSVQFNASNLPSGVYYYRLEAGMNQETRKLLLLK